MDLSFDGVRVPAATVYDFVGWILSATAKPVGKIAPSSRNYYLPLLAMYARWCQLLSPAPKKNIPGMVSIAWITGKSPRRVDVIMGSTIGNIPTDIGNHDPISVDPLNIGTTQLNLINSRALNISRARVKYLTDAGLIPASKSQLPDKDGDEGTKGFGKCAETFFWIYAKE